MLTRGSLRDGRTGRCYDAHSQESPGRSAAHRAPGLAARAPRQLDSEDTREAPYRPTTVTNPLCPALSGLRSSDQGSSGRASGSPAWKVQLAGLKRAGGAAWGVQQLGPPSPPAWSPGLRGQDSHHFLCLTHRRSQPPQSHRRRCSDGRPLRPKSHPRLSTPAVSPRPLVAAPTALPTHSLPSTLAHVPPRTNTSHTGLPHNRSPRARLTERS